jgi:hypothetical protein
VIVRPPKYEPHDFTSSGEIPVINSTMEIEMPTVCRTAFEGLSMLQFAGITETPHDSVFGEQYISAKCDWCWVTIGVTISQLCALSKQILSF